MPREGQRTFVMRRRAVVVRKFVVRVAEQCLPSRQPSVFVHARDAISKLQRSSDILDCVAVSVVAQRLLGSALKIVSRPRLFPGALPMPGELAIEQFEAPCVVLFEGGGDRRMENPPLRDRQEIVGDLLANDVAKLVLRSCEGLDRPQ